MGQQLTAAQIEAAKKAAAEEAEAKKAEDKIEPEAKEDKKDEDKTSESKGNGKYLIEYIGNAEFTDARGKVWNNGDSAKMKDIPKDLRFMEEYGEIKITEL
jgi:hypothetical protein